MIFNKYLLINIYKRNINTETLQKLMQNIIENKTLSTVETTVKNKDFIEKIEKLKDKTEIKVDTEQFESIHENLNQSLNIIKELRVNFRNIKENSSKIELKIDEKNAVLESNNLDTLNNQYENIREISTVNNTILNEKNLNLENDLNFLEKISNTKKSIFDVSWLQPFFDFYNNNSTLVLTIGSGIVLGGIWYMNNIGMINIGSLLTRLGINLLNNVNRESAPVTQPITIINQQPSLPENNRRITNGFFRELGKKVLELMDVFIDNLKKNKIKYK